MYTGPVQHRRQGKQQTISKKTRTPRTPSSQNPVAVARVRPTPMLVRSLSSRVRAASVRGFCSPSSALVTTEMHGRVCVISLNDPKRLNAMTADLGKAFSVTVSEIAEKGDEIGAVVVTGTGRAFSAGGDLDFLQARHRDTPSRNAPIMRNFYQRFLCVRDLPFPVIAAINGPAIGAGLCFALGCDIRVASKKAKMGLTFVGLGLHPGMGATHFLPKIVGPQIASQLMLTGELVTGDEAKDLGLVAHSVDDAVEKAIELATKISSNSPIAVRTLLRTMRTQTDVGLDQALWNEADKQAQCYASVDLADGVSALQEKRAPNFVQYEYVKHHE
jgi:enoyl-CoA hydratase